MQKVMINPWVRKFLESHARSYKKEVYGWLIGYEDNQKNQYIISTIPCQRYIEQEYAHATPDPIEFQEIGAFLPHGLGIIGIYHSHPDSVFHSGTDDSTLQNFTRMYPNMISGVTNGDETRWFCLKNGIIEDIEVVYQKSPSEYRFLLLFTQIHLNFSVLSNKPIIPQLISKITDNFHSSFSQIVISQHDSSLLDTLQSESMVILRSDMNLTMEKDVNAMHFDVNAFSTSKTHAKLTINIADHTSEKDGHPLQVHFGLVGVLFLSSRNYESEESLREHIRSELFDECLSYVSRGYFNVVSESVIEYKIPSSVLFFYPNCVLKIRLLVDNINALKRSLAENQIKKLEKLVEIEDSLLISLRKKFVSLYRAGKTELGKSSLFSLKKIYELRGQNEKVENIKSVMQLLEKL